MVNQSLPSGVGGGLVFRALSSSIKYLSECMGVKESLLVGAVIARKPRRGGRPQAGVQPLLMCMIAPNSEGVAESWKGGTLQEDSAVPSGLSLRFPQ